MTRLYVELSATGGEKVDRSKATAEYVIQRAREAMHPFSLNWKTIEWFGNYAVGQRVAKHFMNPEGRIFLAGDVSGAPFRLIGTSSLTWIGRPLSLCSGCPRCEYKYARQFKSCVEAQPCYS